MKNCQQLVIAYRRHQGFSQSYPQSRGPVEALDDTWVTALQYFWSYFTFIITAFFFFFHTPELHCIQKSLCLDFTFLPLSILKIPMSSWEHLMLYLIKDRNFVLFYLVSNFNLHYCLLFATAAFPDIGRLIYWVSVYCSLLDSETTVPLCSRSGSCHL